jgi:hypothetical protein
VKIELAATLVSATTSIADTAERTNRIWQHKNVVIRYA